MINKGVLKKYKYLLFDADDTLLDFKAAEETALKNVLKNNGLPNDDETVETYSKINLKYWKAFEKGEIERDQIFPLRFGEFLGVMGSDLDPMEVNSQYFEALRQVHTMLPDADELVDYLVGKYKLYIITNGVAKTQHLRLKESGLKDKFDGVFISEELECQKPSIEYFTKVLNAIGNPDKKECLVLGDSISGDILGGKNIGIDTVWVNVRDLKNYTDIKPDYTVTSLKELKEML